MNKNFCDYEIYFKNTLANWLCARFYIYECLFSYNAIYISISNGMTVGLTDDEKYQQL